MKTKYKIIIAAAALVAFFALGYYTRKVTTKPVETGTKVDTVTIFKPVDVTAPEPERTAPTRPVAVRPDEIAFTPDSSSVMVDAEVKTYRDTLADGTSYEAVVSGARPSLESLHIDYPSTVITNTVTFTRPYEGWKLSLTSNNACVERDGWALESQTALELSYTTGPFQFGLQGGLQIEKPFREKGADACPYLGGRITVDLYKFGR